MLAIRMQRTGRTGHSQFRVIVQESRQTPSSGRVIASLGSYNPHTKAAVLEKDKTAFYLEHGAQPSERVARLLQREGVKLPSWVKLDNVQTRTLRHPEKLRKNRPAETVAPVETITTEVAPEEPVIEAEVSETEAVSQVAEAVEAIEFEPAAESAAEEVSENKPETKEKV